MFDTDFGRVGLAICFDLNWQRSGPSMKDKGAELVCWISAYEGGLPLQAHRLHAPVPIVTSVWPYHARIIERDRAHRGPDLALGPARHPPTSNLDKRLFHTDGQTQHIVPMQTRYGTGSSVETFTEEHLFTLESARPGLDGGRGDRASSASSSTEPTSTAARGRRR